MLYLPGPSSTPLCISAGTPLTPCYDNMMATQGEDLRLCFVIVIRHPMPRRTQTSNLTFQKTGVVLRWKVDYALGRPIGDITPGDLAPFPDQKCFDNGFLLTHGAQGGPL